MRKFFIVLIFCGLTSCDFFESEEKKTQELVQMELNAINWNDVDAYPIFEDCDENWSQERQRSCFENGLLKHFSKTLNEFKFTLKKGVNPTVKVDFLVAANGKIRVLDINKDPAIDKQMPEFDKIIRHSLRVMPPLAPAIKNRIPVKAKFRIPIVLNVNQ